MKKVFMLFVLAVSAVLLKADNVDMVTILPDDVAAFVRLDVKDSALMSKVVLGDNKITAGSQLVVGTGTMNIDKIFAGNSLTVQSLDAVLSNNVLQFQTATADTLVIEGNIGGVNNFAVPTGTTRLFINGVELANDIPGNLGWATDVPVNGVVGTGSVYVLSTAH
ncbi:MAG: hypothetical protein LBI01_03630 [Elusimicrobium sp.]|jgi:hypothetical protein|nr:hypothetical protein [Elusimicrobium sp.]